MLNTRYFQGIYKKLLATPPHYLWMPKIITIYEPDKFLRKLDVTVLSSRRYNINAQERICSMINRTKIVIFIRGQPKRKNEKGVFTDCIESQELIEILENENVYYEVIDILKDYNAEEGIKEFSNSDEIPQIYFKGNKFSGGVAELRAMKSCGKLTQLLDQMRVRRRYKSS